MMRRRDFLRSGAGILAGWGGLFGAWGNEGALWVWEGVAFGAPVSIQFLPGAGMDARALSLACEAEVKRLEGIFTLYEEQSLLAELNREGELVDPPEEMLDVLAGAAELHRITGGAFDVTVQPLWDLYYEHFKAHPESEAGPPAEAVVEVRRRVGFDKVEISEGRVAFAEEGMAITLNGIVQGFLTDRVAAMLEQAGVESALVNLGEYRAIGARPDGKAWRIGIASPRAGGDIIDVVGLRDRAIATSGGYGFRFDVRGRFHHMIPQRGGQFSDVSRSVSVEAPEAMWADGLATAGSVMPWEKFAALAKKIEGVRFRVYEGEELVSEAG